MLALWRRRLGYDDLRRECNIEFFEGHDVDGTIADNMRRWYLHMLDTAPPALVPTRWLAPAAIKAAGTSLVRMAIPESARRVLAVESPRWSRPAEPLMADAARVALARLASPFCIPDSAQPLVAVEPDGRAVLAAPLDPSDAVTVLVVTDPGPESYIIDESLLNTIPTTLLP